MDVAILNSGIRNVCTRRWRGKLCLHLGVLDASRSCRARRRRTSLGIPTCFCIFLFSKRLRVARRARMGVHLQMHSYSCASGNGGSNVQAIGFQATGFRLFDLQQKSKGLEAAPFNGAHEELQEAGVAFGEELGAHQSHLEL